MHHSLVHPPHSTLLSSVTAYLSTFTRLEDARTRAQLRARTEPDEDGFITVTRGARAAPAKLEAAEEALRKEEERAKRRIGDGFYRFQNREKAKEQERDLRRKFQEDVKRVEGMRKKRSWKG